MRAHTALDEAIDAVIRARNLTWTIAANARRLDAQCAQARTPWIRAWRRLEQAATGSAAQALITSFGDPFRA